MLLVMIIICPLDLARMIKYDHACQVDLRTIGAIFASMSASEEHWRMVEDKPWSDGSLDGSGD